MEKSQNLLRANIYAIKKIMTNVEELVVKEFIIGKTNPVNACIIYIGGLVNKDTIDRDILNSLMLHVEEDLSCVKNIEEYLCKKYITVSNVRIEKDINKAIDSVKRGNSIILVQGYDDFIVIDTSGGAFRAISDPVNETSIKGARDGFVENLETNVSILRRRLKDENLKTEKFTLGKRSQNDLVMMYIDDVVDKNLVKTIRERILDIDMDSVTSTNILAQCIEDHTYSLFPQTYTTERPDIVQSNILEGRVALILENSPLVITAPGIFIEFFQSVEDYYHRTIVASFSRIIKLIAVFIVVTVPSIYITLIKYNLELIPLNFIQSIVQSRKGIALTPFMSIVSMNLVIEFLREGGLRLPGKVGQTISVVGGIIIGDAALKAKIVSSLTLLVVGISTVASFLIPDYEMALSIRLLNYPMLILSNWLGAFGIAIGIFFLIAYLGSLNSFGVPYFSFNKSDIKDIFIRAPIWKMLKRPDAIPNNNSTRQGPLNWKFGRKRNG